MLNVPGRRFDLVGTELDLLKGALCVVSLASLLTWTALMTGGNAGLLTVPPAASAAWGALALWTMAGTGIVIGVERKSLRRH